MNMKCENMVEHKGMFLTTHYTEIDDSLPGWEIMLQYELYEDRPDREKFHVEVFHRPDQKPFKLPYTVDAEGDATVESTDDLTAHLTDKDAVELLLDKTKEALEGYASTLFLQGQST